MFLDDAGNPVPVRKTLPDDRMRRANFNATDRLPMPVQVGFFLCFSAAGALGAIAWPLVVMFVLNSGRGPAAVSLRTIIGVEAFLILGAAAFLRGSRIAATGRRRRTICLAARLCPGCLYDLAGLEPATGVARCPECGAVWDR